MIIQKKWFYFMKSINKIIDVELFRKNKWHWIIILVVFQNL